MTRKIDFDGEKFIVSFPYQPNIIVDLKRIPHVFRSYSPMLKHWTITPNLKTIPTVLQLAKYYSFSLTTATQAQIDTLTNNVEVNPTINNEIKIEGLGGEFYPFQEQGVNALIKIDTGFIGDEQGLGKTCQGLGIMKHKKAFPLIIVCPASLVLNIEREVNYWLPDKSSFIAYGIKPYGEYPGDVIIITYTSLKNHVKSLRQIKPKGLLLDESQKIKNRKTGCTKAVFELVGFVANQKGYYAYPPNKADLIPNIFCLSGTPVVNRPEEFLTQLKLLGLITKLFSSDWNYLQRYCGAYKSRWGWDFTGASNELELNQILKGSGHYVRRLKKDVLKDLPEKKYSTVPIKLTPGDLRKYKKAEKDIASYLIEEGKTPGLAVHLQKIEALKQLALELKMKAVLDWITTFLESDEKLIVFCTHRQAVEEIGNTFEAPILYGGMTSKQKQNSIDTFQNDNKTRVIVLNILAGGVGYNITAASNVVFVEVGWTPGEHRQAEDRAHRIGQIKQVFIWYLIAWETIEREIIELLRGKQGVISAVTDGVEPEKKIKKKMLATLVKGLKAKYE